MKHLVYSQSPPSYMRFLASRIKKWDILEPTRTWWDFEFAADLLESSHEKFEQVSSDYVIVWLG